MQSLGDRIKRYESAYDTTLIPNSPVFIRVDGKAFHTFTRGMEKPFDHALMHSMILAGMRTAKEMQGFKLAYVQSDECTFCITDFDTHETDGWFGYRLNKLVSITASMFTLHFNYAISNITDELAFFDARAFVVPVEDAPNVFVWRQKDWERNSLQMLAQAHFSHSELNGKKKADMHEMLFEKGINWYDLSDLEKNGTFILRDGSTNHSPWGYHLIDNEIVGA